MARGTYLLRYTKRGKAVLVPKHHVAPPPRIGLQVMSDIEPYPSIITGQIINSRSYHRTHLRDHGCDEVGNEFPKGHKMTEPQGVGQDVKRAFEQWGG